MSNEYRIWRSPRSDFAGLIAAEPDDLTDETCTAVDVYDDKTLAEIAGSGFNGIWVHGLLNNIVRAEPFPELGKNHEIHKTSLRTLIRRAQKYGIRLFIYMQPPRAVPADYHEFWDKHPEAGGQVEIRTDFQRNMQQVTVRSLCTSTSAVQSWLKNASRQIAEELPGLGGLILITASELPAHCYSGRQKDDPRYLIQCPNCRLRHPSDIVVEIINLVRDGIREACTEIAVVAWNWSWTMWGIQSPCREIIDRLPADVILMADFERGGYMDLWRRPRHFINEYCLSYAGPSELCRDVFEAAKEHGMKTMSKLQIGTTHELASVVSLPLLPSIFRKASFHKHYDGVGFMGCWNFGNYLSTNTAAFNYFVSEHSPADEDSALQAFAAAYFPGCDIGTLLQSWRQFNQAMYYYPFCIPFIYNGPMNYTLAYKEMYVPGKLTGMSAGPSHLAVPRGDDLSAAFDFVRGGNRKQDVFTLDEIIVRMEKLAAAWAAGVEMLKTAFASCRDTKAEDELGNAVICGAVWHSTANTFKIYRLRCGWDESARPEFMALTADELAILHAVLPYVERDSRQGYHAEAHSYMFDAHSIRNKISALQSY